VIAALGEAATLRGASVIATEVAVPRALPADELAARWSALAPAIGRVVVRATPEAALDAALLGPGPTVVAGSLYLVGAVRARLVDDPDLRDPALEAS
jgi:folylpolyglutamate synthase/dihydropteroate synthase